MHKAGTSGAAPCVGLESGQIGMGGKMRILAIFLGAWMPVAALAWTEPARGTDLRADLMDALRPHAEWQLGAPLVFVVHDLRVDGDVGFASMSAVRPGGAEIDLRRTPAYARGMLDPEYMDGASFQVLYRRSGRVWVAEHWVLGATDVWWSDPAFCPTWRAVIAEVCR
ncbi:hypothetical protein [Puniceibacterium sp. IMCC21224]|uniref:hypothetical protein n=1 Tax=Puniceibacterium sp. IMCC21224 TaxID=1618204 RepID=UPI00065CF972|nr:hypothetical protein [Puniceibacterium sp. IMCC21224]KMK68327.1 hypothetical protein IMCC21224_113208 [Puniceibacterium sp. IMCC21224]